MHRISTDGIGVVGVVYHSKGITWLEQQSFTLAQKAAKFEQVLIDRHDRHGMTAGCLLPRFGATASPCVNRDDDNNGLWSSLVVVAEYMRYGVTGDPEAKSTASRFFSGMVLLNNVTGKKGLMARSACSPADIKAGICSGAKSWIHDKEKWYNSTNPAYKGWLWKGDTSSDESTGHIFALAATATLSPDVWERSLATELLQNIVSGVVNNNFELIDVTGNATTWGKWTPSLVQKMPGRSSSSSSFPWEIGRQRGEGVLRRHVCIGRGGILWVSSRDVATVSVSS